MAEMYCRYCHKTIGSEPHTVGAGLNVFLFLGKKKNSQVKAKANRKKNMTKAI